MLNVRHYVWHLKTGWGIASEVDQLRIHDIVWFSRLARLAFCLGRLWLKGRKLLRRVQDAIL